MSHRSGRIGTAMNRLLILGLLLIVAPPAAQTPPVDLDGWVQRTMGSFEVPGLALAVVKDGRVVVAKGYGVRKLGEPPGVEARRRSGIAANTKAFPAPACGVLVAPGSTRWTHP